MLISIKRQSFFNIFILVNKQINPLIMNKITLLNVEFLRPNRGIETYELSLKEEKEICYVYNFEDKFTPLLQNS